MGREFDARIRRRGRRVDAWTRGGDAVRYVDDDDARGEATRAVRDEWARRVGDHRIRRVDSVARIFRA